ncbi:MAG: haloacid dehalogenase type II [Nocardioidaceae bacterium]
MAQAGIRAVSFDCYGTLVDWEGGLGAFLYDVARRHGEGRVELEPGRRLRERWEEIQFTAIQGEYRRYADILRDSLTEWASERGLRLHERDGDALVRAMESWQPFPDTVPALRAARAAGLRLAIVSNTDRAIIAHTLRQLEVEFDTVVVAEDARAYKPSSRPFEALLEELDEQPGAVLHAAFGFRYDIASAQRQGMRTAWVNRKREPRPAGTAPDLEWDSLWGLAGLVGRAAS